MTDFKYNKKRFIECCRIYKGELAEYEETRNKSDLSIIEESGLRYIKDDIEYVDNMFIHIKETFGTGTAVILWFLYIEGLTKKEISTRFKLPKDQLRDDIRLWEEEIFN